MTSMFMVFSLSLRKVVKDRIRNWNSVVSTLFLWRDKIISSEANFIMDFNPILIWSCIWRMDVCVGWKRNSREIDFGNLKCGAHLYHLKNPVETRPIPSEKRACFSGWHPFRSHIKFLRGANLGGNWTFSKQQIVYPYHRLSAIWRDHRGLSFTLSGTRDFKNRIVMF